MSYRIRICKNGATPLKVVLGVMLWMFCLSFPLLTHAAEEPGELTLVVKNQYTDRAVADVAITVVERATSNSQTLQTNAQGHNEAFFIVVNNLIRNAFEHKLAGQEPISIHIKAHELVIINESKAASASSSRGYGLGLGIVQRLCERNDWSFTLQVEDNCAAASVAWKVAAKQTPQQA